MHTGFSENEFGTLISTHKCDSCGSDFTVCPAVMPGTEGWDNCLGSGCVSYDEARDANKLFEDDSVEVMREPVRKREC